MSNIIRELFVLMIKAVKRLLLFIIKQTTVHMLIYLINLLVDIISKLLGYQ